MTTLHIPMEIPSQNETGKGLNWRVRAAGIKRIRTTWRLLTHAAMARTGVNRAYGEKRALHIVAYRTRRCSDIANLIGGAKACIDGMVDAGLLTDDKDTMATITYAQDVASKSPTGRPHTVIMVTEMGDLTTSGGDHV